MTSIALKDSNGNVVKNTNGEPIGELSIAINITEDGDLVDPLNPESQGSAVLMYLDVSELSEYPEHQAAYSRFPVYSTQCTKTGTTYICNTANTLYLIATSQKTITIRVHAMDEHGNEAKNVSIGIPMLFDNVAPVPTKIYSSMLGPEGVSVLNELPQATVSMDITEAGSGFNNKMVFIDFGQLGMPVKQASECLAGWTCNWHWIPQSPPGLQSGSRVFLTPMMGTKDDANNLMETTVTGEFIYDSQPPCTPGSLACMYHDTLNSLKNMTGVGEQHDPMTNITEGDSLNIVLYVADHSGIKSARANFSDILQEPADEVAGEC